MMTSGVVFLHDNARPYTAASAQALLVNFNWELLDHPSYSPIPRQATTTCLPTRRTG
jgi:hypothetical protein